MVGGNQKSDEETQLFNGKLFQSEFLLEKCHFCQMLFLTHDAI